MCNDSCKNPLNLQDTADDDQAAKEAASKLADSQFVREVSNID